MTTLLDSNLLIALNVGDHVFNAAARAWFTAHDAQFATCPVTEGALIRHLMRAEWPAEDARALIALVARSPRHTFWPDNASYAEVQLTGVIGHRQVTDAYLAQSARDHQGRLATFDRGLAALHADVVELVPTS